jgi:restriction endonuclease S subunit
MITKDNLKNLLLTLEFEQNGNQYSKKFADSDVIKIPLPPLEIQTQIVEEIEKLEKNKSHFLKEGMSMKDFENVIKETKQAILKKYL